MKTILTLCLVIVTALFSAPALGAVGTVVYSNTTTDTFGSIGYAGNSATELGDRIALAGTERLATLATVQFFNLGTATGTFDATLRLFNPGSPVGSQIGSDVTVAAVIAPSGGSFNVSFTLANVLVPDELIFTVEPTNQTAGLNLFLNLFEPPTIGSSDNSFVIAKSGGNYVSLGTEEQNVYFELRAVPEPATLGVVGVALGAALLRRRRA